MTELNQAPLGKSSPYIDTYTPSLLFPIPRKSKRDEIGIQEPLPFQGWDVWRSYELSWLNKQGKPQVAIAEFIFPCHSPNIIESKSFKLYLNSFNNSCFNSNKNVQETLIQDLTSSAGEEVIVNLYALNEYTTSISTLSGFELDKLDVDCHEYTVNSALIKTSTDEIANEVLHSNLLKSNCLVTGQPDWGSIQIEYHGPKLDKKALLQYLVSFRNHNEFHEQCVERIFNDLLNKAAPSELTVQAFYTRRGGLDINPLRSTKSLANSCHRLIRQ